jgi:UDP-glucose 4-epimerase
LPGSLSTFNAIDWQLVIQQTKSCTEASMATESVLLLGGNGYIGSALALHWAGLDISLTAIDNGLRDGLRTSCSERRDFRDLTSGELAAFNSVVLVAGHSSVGACGRQPSEAFSNNVSAFVDLVHKLRGQKLIFASTSSIYLRTNHLAREHERLPEPVSYYDLHKRMIEQYASIAYPNSIALRFGTVCGPSPNMRSDVLLNSLVVSALRRGYVEVANRDYRRPILGMGDLCRAMTILLTRSIEPGPYNLASANVTIGDAADFVAQRLGVPCREVERPTNYDMTISSNKFVEATGFEFRDKMESLVEELAEFVKHTSQFLQ